MGTRVVILLACGLSGCSQVVADDGSEGAIGQVQQASMSLSELGDDLIIQCGEDGEVTRRAPPATSFSTNMNAGETMYVRGKSYVEFLGPQSVSYKELSSLRLGCAPGTAIVADVPNNEVLSFTAVNV